jgi:hypothetical protein
MYLLFDQKEDSDYVENMLDSFDVYFRFSISELSIVIHSHNISIALRALLNDIQYNLILNRRIGYIATTYADNYPHPDNRVFAVNPIYPQD